MDFTKVQASYSCLDKPLSSLSSSQSSFLEVLSLNSTSISTLNSMLSTDLPELASSISSITALISDLTSRLEVLDSSLLSLELAEKESDFASWKQESYKELQKEEETKKKLLADLACSVCKLKATEANSKQSQASNDKESLILDYITKPTKKAVSLIPPSSLEEVSAPSDKVAELEDFLNF